MTLRDWAVAAYVVVGNAVSVAVWCSNHRRGTRTWFSTIDWVFFGTGISLLWPLVILNDTWNYLKEKQ